MRSQGGEIRPPPSFGDSLETPKTGLRRRETRPISDFAALKIAGNIMTEFYNRSGAFGQWYSVAIGRSAPLSTRLRFNKVEPEIVTPAKAEAHTRRAFDAYGPPPSRG